MSKSSKKKSSYDSAFFIRLAVLMSVAVIVGGGAWYDRAVLIPDADAKIKRVMQLDTGGQADSQKMVADVAGLQPSSTEQIGRLTVQEFRYGRILPFLEPRICTVVFNELGSVVETYTGPMAQKDRDAAAGLVE